MLAKPCHFAYASLLCVADFSGFALQWFLVFTRDASLLYLQALKKEEAEEAARRRKAEAKKAREDAKVTVASFNQFSDVPANSGLSIVWQIVLPRLVAAMCRVIP